MDGDKDDSRTKPSVGETIGHYRILSTLGKGGMGEVYLGEDKRLGRKVAIKLLPAGFTIDTERVRRFAQESRAASALNHPNIITIHEIGEASTEQGATHYIVTEYVEGETLRQRMASAPEKKVSDAIEIALQIAAALSAAHETGIMHRDIKPENVMVRRDGIVKVLDFGLAKLAQGAQPGIGSQVSTLVRNSTETGVVIGTPRYMSPEQARGEKLDARTDIFSLGVLLYEMIAGHAPFEGGTMNEVVAAILRDSPPALAGCAPDVPPTLERIVSRALNKDRDERYQTAKELLLDLKELTGNRASVVAIERERLPFATIKRHKVSLVLGAALVMMTAALYFTSFHRSGQAIDSLAVLPFVNVGSDADTEYLSDGITENLINSLSQIPRLRVVPRGRVFRYKGREIDTEKVGRELNVRAVLTGRVVQRGDSLNIQSELVDVAADSQLWGRQYNRKFSEIVPVQEEIAKEVSEKLHMRPTGEEQRRLTKRYTENPEAHQLYLKGRYLWNHRTTETLRRAAEYFQKATDKDPSYALAWAGLADCYALYPAFSVLPPREAIPKAKEAASKALAFDDTLAEAHTALAYVKSTYDWDWPGAEREFKRAIELNPNYATAHFWYAIHLQALGRLDEAIAEAKLAQEADPVSPIIGLLPGRTFYLARRYDQAIEQLHKTLEMDPNFPRTHWWLAMAYEQVGRHEEAVAESQKAVSLSAGEPTYIGQLGHAYAVSGKKAEAQKVLAELKDLSKRRYVAPFDIARVYMGLGDKSRALEWLEKAYEDHSDWVAWIKVWPQFDSLRGEPRFHDLLRRMGLEP
jgi:eukaryotic-like serine/threonine-protein kinase